MRAVALAVVIAAAAAPVAAQQQPVKAPNTWVSGWVTGVHDPATVSDDASDSYWDFGTALGGGVGVHRIVGPSLALGVEASLAPVAFEQRGRQTGERVEGDAKMGTALVTGRLNYGGGASFGMYLTGGAGAFFYGMPAELGGWDPDAALLTGAGLEYRPSGSKALFVEWGRFWTFHQHEGVKSNSAKHGALRAGMRFGF